ncbi:MAG: EF-P lysine aminoacylase GenX [Alphaproteobacteria bacterium CG_4_9_14_3_um_filter_47_13]|nr:MAG: EF-P lysine aminoacylase GenX [Alphaproteobacteria bacterium CG_4_9_14_3_um_filter_47_13]
MQAQRKNELYADKWWYPENFASNLPYLKMRMGLIKAVRAYFDAQDFYEIETPILQVCPVMDTHIHAFASDILGVDLKKERTLYLHTSPEFAMKKLMVAGIDRLYQICHVFRNGEGSRLHSPEFTMIEWYRAPGGYEDIMEDCIGLLRFCAEKLGVKTFRHKDKTCDPFKSWQKISVAEAFMHYADIDLTAFLEDKEGFSRAIAAQGIRVAEDDRWDDLFFRVMADKIEPFLGMEVPTIIYDYPASMASLSRRKPDAPRFAERFELYVCGIELANAFGELTDAVEQETRFHEEMAVKNTLYGEQYPIDEDFIHALKFGLPDSGGIALGIDRFAMLVSGAEDIAQVLWAGKP